MSTSNSPVLPRTELEHRPRLPRQAPAILILDPDLDSRRILAALLRANGYSTLEAADIDEARQYALLTGFALVISEARGGDGHAVLPAAVRAELGMTEVPLIVHTSWLHPDDKLSATASGALAFIAKPYDHRALLGLVARIVRPGYAALDDSDRPGPARVSRYSPTRRPHQLGRLDGR
jgi:DNA-binding NtrC family response regulator